MDRAFRNKNNITRFDLVSLVTDGDRRFTTQDVLFVLQRIGMARHAATLLHRKFAQGKIWSLLGRDQHLDRRIFSRCDVFRFHITGMFYSHRRSPWSVTKASPYLSATACTSARRAGRSEERRVGKECRWRGSP